VIGANTVLARPPAKVNTVSALTLRDPNQRVNAANAGGYNTAPIATPATSQATTNQPKFGAVATPTSDAAASPEPAVMILRGPCRSSQRPTPIPISAEVTSPDENAAATAG
jgi:hypothetical protein